ncbi:guanylate kinase [Anaerosalibacter bizertensis]|uniref:Guanylate kinase n=1 Tax=Anaerosalibacter bizertensis TaxID=932217 RepID=A0A844FIZ4_9FIRM|nr:guanylate kinase [Anaerosalibacter bizertensis]MBV1816612.1 guanylate kinase [Bacteroidales bacterium MSK.15.36]HHV27174.1 guanylate kinase [Tissierellia bacterium]MCB5558584.1 guanylate kinase [Anaerosalibacter bizertensis]MCG4563999.1 guanylate kinase [Anaerosalibacter bizertensis]MCG4581767.1 guanylate kinase [Anaerosalibacter bizertensis]
MAEGLLVVVSGPSGCGKGTICKELLKRNKDMSISISATTRKPRKGEVDGENYFFLTEEIFKSMINKNEFLEYAHVHGNFYGTPKKFVLEKIENGENVFLEIDVQGALQIKEIYPDGVFIFILPPSMEELKNRIIKRGTESEDDIKRRYKNAFEEVKYIKKYDYLVINDKVIEAVEKIESIISAEKCSVDRQSKLINKILS